MRSRIPKLLLNAAGAAAALACLAFQTSTATPAVPGVEIAMMKCCGQVATVPSSGSTYVLIDQSVSRRWAVLVTSPSPTTVNIRSSTLQNYATQVIPANIETLFNIDTTGSTTQGLQVYAVNGARVRVIQGPAYRVITNATGVASFGAPAAGDWIFRANASSPTHIEVRVPGIAPASFDLPVGGIREVTVTANGTPGSTVVTATRYEPPILVRRPPTPGPRN